MYLALANKDNPTAVKQALMVDKMWTGCDSSYINARYYWHAWMRDNKYEIKQSALQNKICNVAAFWQALCIWHKAALKKTIVKTDDLGWTAGDESTQGWILPETTLL